MAGIASSAPSTPLVEMVGFCQASGEVERLERSEAFQLGRKSMKAEEIKRVVKERYSKAAHMVGEDSCCCPSAPSPGAGFAGRQGHYTPEDLASVPELVVKLSRGCGNPVSFADLRAGEVVVDLGCSAGIDVIFAAHRIAPGGRRRGFRTAND
jgi:hypothetical protein